MRQLREIRIGIIGGTGIGEALSQEMPADRTESHHPETPFGRPSAPIVTGQYHGVPIALLQRHGPGHVFNPAAVPSRANIFALKALGCTHIVAFGATGSLRESIRPADLVVCDQLIDKTDGRARTFFENAAVHVEFADPFCPVMRDWLLSTARQALEGTSVHERGTYLCMEGPSFSTRAESHMHRAWGADLVGMTALPEARLAREAEIAYALIALPTDYDCWRPRPETDQPAASLIKEIKGHLEQTSTAAFALLRAALRDVSVLCEQPSPAHDALRLAIWSDKNAVNPDEVKRLDALWGRYF